MEKEMVQKFDLEAAFKALNEIDTPKAEKGIRANRVDLKERFAAKTYGDALVEDYYNVNDKEALEEAKEDREEEVAKAKLARIEKIVDLDAESPEDLLPSYVGKVIIQCPQCMTLFYKNPEDIEKSEENPDVVNINEICQHCGNASGYTLIGKVGKVSEDEAANYEAAEEGAEEDELSLDFNEPTEEVSPEGTGGGFEEEEIAVEEGSEDSSDDEPDLDAADLAPTDESLKHEQLNEEVEDTKVEVEAEEILDAAAKAGKEVAKEAEADITEAEVKEITDKVVTKELGLPVVEEGSDDSSDDELDEALSPKQVEQKLTAYAASLGVEEGLKEGIYDVSDAEFKAMLKDKTFQEFGEALTEETSLGLDPSIVMRFVKPQQLYSLTPEELKILQNPRSDRELVNKIIAKYNGALTEEKIKESKISTAAVEKAISEINAIGAEDVEEDIDIADHDSPTMVDGAEHEAESCEGRECDEEKHVCEKCEDLHERSLNKHISAYLTEVYANVKDFTATNCSLNGDKLVIEGTINFNSGKSRATKFEFTETKNGESGKIVLEGHNKDLAEDARFTLDCSLEDGGTCLLTEGFGYKYTINGTLVEGLK